MMGIIAEGQRIYDKLLPTLLPHYPSQYIVINTENSEYWIDTNMLKAIKEAQKKYPDKKFYIAKIGVEEGAIAAFK